jgi:hypothetical protein
MDKVALVHKRKKRYMAQILDQFEQEVEPHLPSDVAENFKGTIRRKLHALALDACEVMTLKPGEAINGAFIELRDRIQGDARDPHRGASNA